MAPQALYINSKTSVHLELHAFYRQIKRNYFVVHITFALFILLTLTLMVVTYFIYTIQTPTLVRIASMIALILFAGLTGGTTVLFRKARLHGRQSLANLLTISNLCRGDGIILHEVLLQHTQVIQYYVGDDPYMVVLTPSYCIIICVHNYQFIFFRRDSFTTQFIKFIYATAPDASNYYKITITYNQNDMITLKIPAHISLMSLHEALKIPEDAY